MLVLTRKVGEGIAIGDDIKIIVMQIKGKQVRLGIKASAQTVVHREEVYQRIQEENRNASQSKIDSVAQAQEMFTDAEKRPGPTLIRRVHRGTKKSDSEE